MEAKGVTFDAIIGTYVKVRILCNHSLGAT
jgi:hypothetical protein